MSIIPIMVEDEVTEGAQEVVNYTRRVSGKIVAHSILLGGSPKRSNKGD
jgi:hypothetical protein